MRGLIIRNENGKVTSQLVPFDGFVHYVGLILMENKEVPKSWESPVETSVSSFSEYAKSYPEVETIYYLGAPFKEWMFLEVKDGETQPLQSVKAFIDDFRKQLESNR